MNIRIVDGYHKTTK